LVARFATRSAQLESATALPGNAADAAQLQSAAAAVLTAGDVLAHAAANSSGRGVGLRGGTFRLMPGAAALRVTLDRVRWVDDVAVTGTILAPRRGGWARAALRVTPTEGAAGRLLVRWPLSSAVGPARVTGAFGRAKLLAQCPAP